MRLLYHRLLQAFLLLSLPAFSEAFLHQPLRDLTEADHWKRARALVSAQLKQNPDDWSALVAMSGIEESFGALDKARTLAERAVALAPHSADTHAQLARVCAVSAETAPVWRQVGLVRVMKRELEAAYKIDPNHLDALLVDMMFTYKAPGIVGGGKAKAHAIAKKIAAAHPDWGRLAEAKLAQHDDNEPVAIRELQQATPSNYRAQTNLALVYCCLSRNPRYEEAEKIGRQLLEKEPARIGGYEIMAQIHAARQSFQDLERTLAEAVRHVPDDLSPYYWAAKKLIANRSDLARAEAYLRKYLSQEPEGRAPTFADAQALLQQLKRR